MSSLKASESWIRDNGGFIRKIEKQRSSLTISLALCCPRGRCRRDSEGDGRVELEGRAETGIIIAAVGINETLMQDYILFLGRPSLALRVLFPFLFGILQLDIDSRSGLRFPIRDADEMQSDIILIFNFRRPRIGISNERSCACNVTRRFSGRVSVVLKLPNVQRAI